MRRRGDILNNRYNNNVYCSSNNCFLQEIILYRKGDAKSARKATAKD